MIVVDTSILIDHLRGDDRARDALVGALRSKQRLYASVMSKVEVLAGMRPSEEQRTRTLFQLVEWVPVTDSVAERAGELARSFLHSHPGVDPTDYVIAATAEHLEAALWTRNAKHFPMFPDISDPYSTQI